MKIPVLDKQETWHEHGEKLHEEFEELMTVIYNLKDKEKNIEEIVREALDVVQVCVGILKKAEEEGTDINLLMDEHVEKLKGRGWNFKEMLYIMPCKPEDIFDELGGIS